MPPDILDRFARLLTSDTDACAGLFAPDAVFLARLGSCQLRLVGRSEIRRFLTHVPRQIAFAGRPLGRDGDEWLGELESRSHDLAPRAQQVRFALRDGQFQSFEHLQ